MKAIGTRSRVGIELEQEEDFYLDLSGAHLVGAHLSGADLTGARLDGADLTGADLTGADLTGANLTDSTLSKAKGLTQQQLDRAVAMSAYPPELGGLRDAKTGGLLEWHGGEPKFPSLGAAPGR